MVSSLLESIYPFLYFDNRSHNLHIYNIIPFYFIRCESESRKSLRDNSSSSRICERNLHNFQFRPFLLRLSFHYCYGHVEIIIMNIDAVCWLFLALHILVTASHPIKAVDNNNNNRCQSPHLFFLDY